VGRLRAIVDGLAVAEAAGAADEEHEREHAEGSAGGRHRVAATARELAARGQISRYSSLEAPSALLEMVYGRILPIPRTALSTKT
jgi:hypothetical protein